MVTGPVVTQRYVTRLDQNALHKVSDGGRIWHRMGDVGYLDDQDRFWFCGRKAHRVVTDTETLFTIPCESILNTHPSVFRSALVGVEREGSVRPVLVVEPTAEHRGMGAEANELLVAELKELAQQDPKTRSIAVVLIYPERLPVDIRHNSKIFREQLAVWASEVGSEQDKGS